MAALWKREGREITARFGGTSMAPTIPAGGEVRVACGVLPEAGQVGLLILGGRVVVHRVVGRARDGRWVLTRGDAALIPDPPVTEADLVGRVVTVHGCDGHRPPAPGPRSLGRRIAAAVVLRLMERSPAAGRRFIRALWEVRRWVVLAPRVAARRLFARGPA